MYNPTLDHYMLFLIFKDSSYSSNIIPQTLYPHCLLTLFWLSGHEILMKENAQGCNNYRFILWSFIMIMPIITSTLLFTSQMSQSYSLTYYSFLLKTSNNLTLSPPALILSENISSFLCCKLNFAETLSYSFIFNITFSCFCSGSLEESIGLRAP